MDEPKYKQCFRVTDTGIYGFFEDYRFLSNFELSEVDFDGEWYPSVEHAYQAAKTIDRHARIPFITNSQYTVGQAKKAGQLLTIRDDWEDVKYHVMLGLVFKKFFYNDELRNKLIATDGKYLEETNYWGDNIWGVDYRGDIGKNWLGQILMDVRKCFKSEHHILTHK